MNASPTTYHRVLYSLFLLNSFRVSLMDLIIVFSSLISSNTPSSWLLSSPIVFCNALTDLCKPLIEFCNVFNFSSDEYADLTVSLSVMIVIPKEISTDPVVIEAVDRSSPPNHAGRTNKNIEPSTIKKNAPTQTSRSISITFITSRQPADHVPINFYRNTFRIPSITMP